MSTPREHIIGKLQIALSDASKTGILVYLRRNEIESLIAALQAAEQAEKQEPVAWLKEWNDAFGRSCVRVDLESICEMWLERVGPKISPLFRKLPGAADEKS